MDFIDRLCDFVNKIPDLPAICVQGKRHAAENFVVYALPDSKIQQTYMDNQTDQTLNYEFAFRSDSLAEGQTTLWKVQNQLENITDLSGQDHSFEFQNIKIINKPYLEMETTNEVSTFLLTIQANITVKNQEEN